MWWNPDIYAYHTKYLTGCEIYELLKKRRYLNAEYQDEFG